MKIKTATIEDLEVLVPLFNGYRVFYKRASDISAAKHFLKDRFRKGDSVIFLAIAQDGTGLGFTHLYPSFSSVAMQRVYILNDLFVDPEFRGHGIGEKLMEHAKTFAVANNCLGLTLETAKDNPAQKLYERLGWTKDTEVFHYTWEINKSI
jgi:GNAT superfamily N-acetyltransferase